MTNYITRFNTLNAELNPICNFLALLGAHHILHVGRIRVKSLWLLWLREADDILYVKELHRLQEKKNYIRRETASMSGKSSIMCPGIFHVLRSLLRCQSSTYGDLSTKSEQVKMQGRRRFCIYAWFRLRNGKDSAKATVLTDRINETSCTFPYTSICLRYIQRRKVQYILPE